jgi:hypothetical protein
MRFVNGGGLGEQRLGERSSDEYALAARAGFAPQRLDGYAIACVGTVLAIICAILSGA